MINSSIMYTAIIVIVIIIITIIINLFILLSDLVLFPGKICHNSRHQPVVLDVVAFFFPHFISNTFHIILVVPSK